jgi:mannose/cellobiose epimerase-like protein (N-acyl-D-glucosamine 2-epimerase family)
MMENYGMRYIENMKTILTEMKEHLKQGILSFWIERGIDQEFGGYFTCFNEHSRPTGK